MTWRSASSSTVSSAIEFQVSRSAECCSDRGLFPENPPLIRKDLFLVFQNRLLILQNLALVRDNRSLVCDDPFLILRCRLCHCCLLVDVPVACEVWRSREQPSLDSVGSIVACTSQRCRHRRDPDIRGSESRWRAWQLASRQKPSCHFHASRYLGFEHL